MSYDYVVVGGGPAGCVTTSRLVKEQRARVLLLEAGPRNNSPLLRMPAGFIKMLSGSKYLTHHPSVPQPQLDGRMTVVPQGRVLGGGSSVNGLVYMRGRPDDYALWQAASGGEVGWGWDNLLPHFVRLEHNQSLGGPMHGTNGPLHVSNPGSVCEMSDVFVKTLQEIGLPYRHDFNGGEQHGAGYMQVTARRGRRWGAVDAFLDPVMGDPLLEVRTDALCLRVLLDNNRAVGVEYSERGQVKKALAGAEVIVTAGAYGTPKLLMLSGIGPAERLHEHDIVVNHDIPGVGENLMDHHEVPVVAACDGHYGYYGEDHGLRMVLNGLQYLLFRSGPVSSNGVESCAFVNPLDPGALPSLQLYCVPTVYLDGDVSEVRPCDGVTLNSCLLRPKARGTVRLRSNDPSEDVLVNPNYLGHEDDVREEIAGLRFAREVLASNPMARYVAAEMLPRSDKVSDEDLAEHCRKTVKTNYHPCGTCRMGKADDPMAVLTPDLRLKGVDGLRVFDVSMMPCIPSANLNAVAMAVADRAVDVLTGSA